MREKVADIIPPIQGHGQEQKSDDKEKVESKERQQQPYQHYHSDGSPRCYPPNAEHRHQNIDGTLIHETQSTDAGRGSIIM